MKNKMRAEESDTGSLPRPIGKRMLRTGSVLLLSVALISASNPSFADLTDWDALVEQYRGKLDYNLLSEALREKIDLQDYVVTNPDASYFDVEARRKAIAESSDPFITAQAEHLSMGVSCRQVLELPTLSGERKMPSFYRMQDDWREAVLPYAAFEEAMQNLAGSFVVTGDVYYVDCIADVLLHWADEEAFLEYENEGQGQVWFATESPLFSAGLAYSLVRPYVHERRPEDAAIIEHWLNAASWRHLGLLEPTDLSCCNNHFYRRGLHATVIGIVTNDNGLFQHGISGVFLALSEINEHGGLPRELARQHLAVHYQNFALLYLVTIMQLAYRQGYDLFEYEVNGHTIGDAVVYALESMRNPMLVEEEIGFHQQMKFMDDNQYFTWMEIMLTHLPFEKLDEVLRSHRPVFNRSAGGYMTLYFYRGSDEGLTPHVIEVEDIYVSRLRKCAQHRLWFEERDIEWRAECEHRARFLELKELDE